MRRLHADSNIRRIVLLGKTGSGKSSLANTLFGEDGTFTVNHSANSETKVCASETRTINGRNVQLVDTPGFFDTDPKSSKLSPELLKCIVQCAPGPHAFLLVLKIEKFTVLELASVALMLGFFSKEVLNYTTVVFTRGDDLPPEMEIHEWVNENKDLKNLVDKCGGRCHVIDNKYWNNSQHDYRNNQHQIEELLKTIDKTVEKNGGHYTNEMLQQVHQMSKENVLDFLKRNKGLIIAVVLGAFIGGLAGRAVGCYTQKCVGVGVGAVVGAALGGIFWGSGPPPPPSPQENVNVHFSEEVTRYVEEVTLLYEQLLKVRAMCLCP